MYRIWSPLPVSFFSAGMSAIFLCCLRDLLGRPACIIHSFISFWVFLLLRFISCPCLWYSSTPSDSTGNLLFLEMFSVTGALALISSAESLFTVGGRWVVSSWASATCRKVITPPHWPHRYCLPRFGGFRVEFFVPHSGHSIIIASLMNYQITRNKRASTTTESINIPALLFHYDAPESICSLNKYFTPRGFQFSLLPGVCQYQSP